MNRSLLISLWQLKQDYPDMYEVIAAWLMFESRYGQNKLSKLVSNHGSLKYRSLKKLLHPDVYARVGVFEYVDWQKKKDKYLKIYDPKDYPEVFFAFLKRYPYRKPTRRSGVVVSEQFIELGKPLSLLTWAAECGYCGSISGVLEENFPNEKKYKQAVAAEYVRRVLKVMKGKKYKEVLEAVTLLELPA